MATPRFSDHVIYVDEAGDHGPASTEFPAFVLAFCVFKKTEYADVVTPAMQKLKFKHFGHDAVVLHERDIRKATRPFDILQDRARREEFFADMDGLVTAAPFTIIAAAIDKVRLANAYSRPANPYHLALTFGLERIAMLLSERSDWGQAHVVFEARGKREDDELELEFRRVCASNMTKKKLNMEPIFTKKSANHCGLQLADLMARPIGLHVLRPTQPNRAFEIIKTKLRRSRVGKVEGFGLKVFP